MLSGTPTRWLAFREPGACVGSTVDRTSAAGGGTEGGKVLRRRRVTCFACLVARCVQCTPLRRAARCRPARHRYRLHQPCAEVARRAMAPWKRCLPARTRTPAVRAPAASGEDNPEAGSSASVATDIAASSGSEAVRFSISRAMMIDVSRMRRLIVATGGDPPCLQCHRRTSGPGTAAGTWQFCVGDAHAPDEGAIDKVVLSLKN
jgi:hypothetical protein